MHALAANPAEWNMGDKAPMRLSMRAQITTGIIIALALAGSFLLAHGSFLLFEAMIGAAAAFLIVQSPVASLLAFIMLNVAITIHGKDSTSGGFSGFDLVLGGMLVLIMAYWLIRIRFFERTPLSTSVGQLSLLLFFVWAVIVTAIGLTGEHTDANNAIRELLNLSPLLVLPAIYERNVKLGSKAEKWIFISVLVAGVLIVGWNLHGLRHSLSNAFYLYQIGRGNSDEMLSFVLVVIATSFLMTVRGFWKTFGTIAVLLLGLCGVVICLARTLYIATIVCTGIILLLGNPKERWRGIRRIILALFGLIALIVPIFLGSRFFRLLLLHYGLRFLSSQHLGTDLSLLNRYSEWKYEWQSILHSPLLGHGFGTKFRTYDIILHQHEWTSFSHSSYLYMIFKTGFIGASLFVGAFVSFLIKGFRLLKVPYFTVFQRSILRVAVAYMLGFLIYAYTAPVLDSKTDLIWLALFWGFFLSAEKAILTKGF